MGRGIFMISLEVGDVGHGCFRKLVVIGVAVISWRRRIIVEGILLVNDQEAGLCLVGDLAATDGDGALGGLAFIRKVPGRERLFVFSSRLGRLAVFAIDFFSWLFGVQVCRAAERGAQRQGGRQIAGNHR